MKWYLIVGIIPLGLVIQFSNLTDNPFWSMF